MSQIQSPAFCLSLRLLLVLFMNSKVQHSPLSEHGCFTGLLFNGFKVLSYVLGDYFWFEDPLGTASTRISSRGPLEFQVKAPKNTTRLQSVSHSNSNSKTFSKPWRGRKNRRETSMQTLKPKQQPLKTVEKWPSPSLQILSLRLHYQPFPPRSALWHLFQHLLKRWHVPPVRQWHPGAGIATALSLSMLNL